MNWKTITTACLVGALNIGLLPSLAHADIKAETYTYGTHLDIQKVLSLSEDTGQGCDVVNARMTYLDSQGQTRILEYIKLAESCSQGS